MMKFNYQNKQYQIDEPTVEMWSKLTLLQEWTDEREFCVKLLSFITGLTEEEIENSDYMEVVKLSNEISVFLTQDGDKFYNEFSFNNKNYRFLDLPNLTFGEFIDIDTYLTKEPHEKKKEMPLLMAMLYREVDDKGNTLPYDSGKVYLRGEEFKKLPVKYIHGASSFFLRGEKLLRGNMTGFSWRRTMMILKMIWLLVKFTALTSFGVGLALLLRLPTKISQRWTKSRNTR
jgi:hypothetical protein